MNNKKILLLGGNFSPELTGIGKYNGEMIAWLASHGYECTVITTYPYYPQWKVQDSYTRNSWWYKKEIIYSENSLPVKVIRCPHYIPGNPSGLKRIISDISFFASCFFVVLVQLFKKRNNYVMTVAPPFQVGLLGILYKITRRAKFIYHIQDLQVDAARDLGMIKSRFILKLLFAVERFILKRTNYISTISAGMMKKVEAKCNKEVIFFPNWSDIDFFRPLENKDQYKPEFGFNISDRIILYSGAIGEKQGLEAILHSANYLSGRKDVKFIICGTGPYKENLMKIKEEMKLGNVTFLPLQPGNKFNKMLNIADVHLVLQKAVASDLVLPSKLTAILAVGGLSIVTAPEGTSLYELVKNNNTGIVIEPDNQLALNNALSELVEPGNENIRQNARKYAEENLSIDKILHAYSVKVFEENDVLPLTSTKQLVTVKEQSRV